MTNPFQIGLFALALLAAPAIAGRAHAQPACATPDMVSEHVGAEPLRTLSGAQAAKFFEASNGPASGLPVPDVIAAYAVPEQPDYLFVVLFRAGCLYGRGFVSRAEVESIMRSAFGLPS
jgi:hypothetical protein